MGAADRAALGMRVGTAFLPRPWHRLDDNRQITVRANLQPVSMQRLCAMLQVLLISRTLAAQFTILRAKRMFQDVPGRPAAPITCLPILCESPQMTHPMIVTLPDGTSMPRLGLGTRAIGGRWMAGGEPAGWGETDDDVSRATIRAGVAGGVRLFDTAQAYGAGHAERLLGDVLAAHPEVRIVTKVGLIINEDARTVERATTNPDDIEASLDASRRRLRRDRIEMVLLHLNSLSPDDAAPVFDRLEALRHRGWIGHFGWSTDFPASVAAMTGRAGFAVVEHAMNVFFAADGMGRGIAAHGLLPLIRSPLAMGLLGGRYPAGHVFGPDDVRSTTTDWMDYFKDCKVTQDHALRLERLRAALTSQGRSMAQGALAWLFAANARVVPVPGFRTVAQVQDLCGAIEKGPLDHKSYAAVEANVSREAEGDPRER